MVLFLFFTSTIVFNLKPSSHHLPRLALLFAGGVILVYLMNEIKMLLLLLLSTVAWARVQSSFGPHTFDLMSLDSNCCRDRDGNVLSHYSPWPTPNSSGTNEMFLHSRYLVATTSTFFPLSSLWGRSCVIFWINASVSLLLLSSLVYIRVAIGGRFFKL